MPSRKQQEERKRRDARANKAKTEQAPQAVPPPAAAQGIEKQDSAKAGDGGGGGQNKAVENGPSDWERRHSLVQIFVGVGLLAFTLVQAAVTGMQWVAMREQNAQIGQQLEALSDQNELAAGSLEQAIRDQRPWIGVGSPEIVQPITPERVLVTTRVTNYGRTPAQLTEVSGTFFNYPNPPAIVINTPTMADIKKHLEEYGTRSLTFVVIQPGETVTVPVPLTGPGMKLEKFFGEKPDTTTLFFFSREV